MIHWIDIRGKEIGRKLSHTRSINILFARTDTLRQAIGDVNRRRCGNDAFALEKKKKKKRKRKRERSFERNRALICTTRDVELEKGDFY